MIKQKPRATQLTTLFVLIGAVLLAMVAIGVGQSRIGADINTQNQTNPALNPVLRKTIQGPPAFDPEAAARTERCADPNIVCAQTEFGTLENLGQYMQQIMKYALPLGVALAVIMMIYAGILFMASQGQPDRIKDGQEVIQGAILGLVILILARLIATYLFIPGALPSNPLVTTERSQQ